MCVANKNKVVLNCGFRSREEKLLCPAFHFKISGSICHQVECVDRYCSTLKYGSLNRFL